MDDRESDSDALHSCPYLGLDSDPSIRCLFLTSSHRCFRWPTPQPVDYQQQRSYCLSGGFQECSWFVSAVDSPSRRRRGASPPVGTGLLALVAVVAVAVLTLVFFKPWTLLMPSSEPGSVASASQPTPASTPAGALSGTLTPSASTPLPEGTAQPLTATSSPAPSPTRGVQSAAPTPSSRPASTPVRPAATPVATPSGTSGAAAVKIYTVKSGDNLYSLARTFGVTVDDIMKANKLQDRSTLSVGQTLVIPQPTR